LSKMQEIPSTFRGGNALITGVGGFLGRRLSRHLLQAGIHVIGLGNESEPLDTTQAIEYYRTDVLIFDELESALQKVRHKRPVIFHLAGESNVGKSRTDPLSAWAVNVTGTAHLLEACRRADLQHIVFPSTALVYARVTEPPYHETDPVQVSSIYSSTKLAAEALIKSYSVDFGFVCHIARLGNVYGPGGPAESIVSIILRQAKAGGPITLKTLSSIRDFIYCDDVASGLVTLASYTAESGFEIFNVASGIPTSIRTLAQTACNISEIETSIIETEPQPSAAIDNLTVSIERIMTETPWRPEWKLEDGLRQTLSEMELKRQ